MNLKYFLFDFCVYFLFFLLSQIVTILGGNSLIKNVFPFIFGLVLCSFFLSYTSRKIYFFVISSVFAIFNIIYLGSSFLLDTNFTYEYAISLLLSNIAEVSEFICSLFSWKMLLILFCSLLPTFLIKFLPYRVHWDLLRYCYILIPLTYVTMYCGAGFVYNNTVLYNLWCAGEELFSYHDEVKKYQNINIKDVKDLNPDVKKKTYIVILSDSVGRSYMSLYGYKYKNTPFLDSIKGQLYIFDNVTTKYNVTYEVLERLLTFSEGNDDENKVWEEPRLLDLYKKAGFKIYWLSSHQKYGITNKFSHMTEIADVKFFRNVTASSTGDEIVLPYFRAALADKSPYKVIFLHLQGSHNQYSARFPLNFGKDSEAIQKLSKISGVSQLFVDYITSILYGDELLKRIFEMMNQYELGSSYLLYLSDHAEDVDIYGNAYFCHGNIYKKKVLEIPFILWLSSEYKKYNSSFVANLIRNLHKSYEINLLTHALLDLSMLDYELVDKTKSIFSEKYRVRLRKYDELQY